MSGTVETRRVAAPQPPPVDTHAAESARPAAPPTSAAEIREAAIASVDTARASHTAARRSPTWQDAAGAVARAYDDGGLPGLRSHLARHPESLRAIATAPRAQVEELMSDVAGSWDGPAALEEIQSQVAGRLREGVRRRALSTIDRHCGQLERMRSFAHDNLDALRTAPADSPEGELAAKLGIGPKASQALVDARIDGALEGLSDLRARFLWQRMGARRLPRQRPGHRSSRAPDRLHRRGHRGGCCHGRSELRRTRSGGPSSTRYRSGPCRYDRSRATGRARRHRQ